MKLLKLIFILCMLPVAQLSAQDSVTFNPGNDMKRSAIRHFFLGKAYRDVWKTDVKAPVLKLGELGLTPTESGGRLETNSLRLKDAAGRTYVGRSVNKDLSKILPPKKRNGLFGNLLRDHASANEPYAALVVADLAERIKILHSTPKLYVLPKDSSLGEFAEEYGGLPVLFEERPSKGWKHDPLFKSPEKIIETEKLIKMRFEDGNVTVDREHYLKGRLLDMLVGDWSRHDEQYKWALVPKDSGFIAYPIARDRDHAFFRVQGLMNKLSLVVWPYSSDFDRNIKRIRHLNHMAGNMDQMILPEISKAEWFRITAEFMKEIDDAAIENSVKKLPPETYVIDGKELEIKLKSRLKQMPVASLEFYKHVNRYPFIPATNKKDRIEIRMNEDTMQVRLYRKKSAVPYFSRTFAYPESGLVTIAAMDGEDRIELEGKSKIRLNILQGPSDDSIVSKKLEDGENIMMFDTRPRKIYDYLTSGIKNESKRKKNALKKVE